MSKKLTLSPTKQYGIFLYKILSHLNHEHRPLIAPEYNYTHFGMQNIRMFYLFSIDRYKYLLQTSSTILSVMDNKMVYNG